MLFRSASSSRFKFSHPWLCILITVTLYFTVSSIYRFGKGAGERMQIRHIERLELELRQRQEADSVKHLKDFNYDDERKTE